MSLLTVAAIYFIMWWTVLFVVLPLGYRSQQEDGDVAVGTIASAPTKFRAGRVILLTTVISAALFAAYHVGAAYLGLSIANIPNIVPSFE